MKVVVSIDGNPDVLMEGILDNLGSNSLTNGTLVTDFQLKVMKSSVSEVFFNGIYHGKNYNLTVDGEIFNELEFMAMDDDGYVFLRRMYTKLPNGK